MNLRGPITCVALLATACSSNSERRDVHSAGSAAVTLAMPVATAPHASLATTSVAARHPIAAFQTRDHTVRVYADGGTLRVTVLDDAGQLVADRITLDELRALDPFLHQACTNAVAGAPRGAFLDARLYVDDVDPRAR